MPDVARLTIDQLMELERLLAEQRAPVVERLRPPASAEALAAVEAHLGRPLPHELRCWWGWHDGSDVKAHEAAAKGSLGPAFQFLRAQQAVEISRQLRVEAEAEEPEDADSLWGSSWIAIGSLGRVACEGGVPPNAPVPVLDVDYHKAAYPGAPTARSLGEMVSWWIEAIKTGAWRYDDEHDRWERREDLVPPEHERGGLV